MTPLLLALFLAQTTDPPVRNDPGARMVGVEDAAPAAKGGRGLDAALAIGLAFPAGDATGHAPLGDVLDGALDVELQVGAKATRHLWLGVYGGGLFGPARLGEARDGDALGARGGALVRVDLRPAGGTNPWLAVGSGYEILAVHRGGSAMLASLRGREDVRLEAGLDLRRGGKAWLGLFAAASTGRYEAFGGSMAPALRLDDRARHWWISVGSRFRAGP